MRRVRGFHDSRKRDRFQHARISFAFCGTAKYLRSHRGLCRRGAFCFRKRCRGILEHCLHQFDQLGWKNRPSEESRLPPSNPKANPAHDHLNLDFSEGQYFLIGREDFSRSSLQRGTVTEYRAAPSLWLTQVSKTERDQRESACDATLPSEKRQSEMTALGRSFAPCPKSRSSVPEQALMSTFGSRKHSSAKAPTFTTP